MWAARMQDGLAASVDGKAAQTPGALVAAMANGRALAALSAGRVIANVSLQGASAALRYMDVEQGRAGTVTALVAKGLKPARAVPAPPTPVIVALTPGGTPAAPRPNQLAAMRRAAACDGEQRDKPEFHALGGGQTLVLLPCSAGAYNLSQALFVLDGKGFVPARSDAPVGFADGEKQPVPTVVNGRWEKAMLTSHAKGRGIGDCGVSRSSSGTAPACACRASARWASAVATSTISRRGERTSSGDRDPEVTEVRPIRAQRRSRALTRRHWLTRELASIAADRFRLCAVERRREERQVRIASTVA